MRGHHMLWSWTGDLKRTRGSSGIRIKPPTIKVDRGLVAISVPVAACKAFQVLNFAIDTFPQGVRYPVLGIGYDIVYMRS